MKNIFVLPTNQPTNLVKNNKDELKLTIQLLPYDDIIECYPQHVYITSEEEIKKDEYYLGDDNHIYNLVTSVNNNGKKIILTTNPTLIADGVQSIDDEFLEWFVKNPNCEFVETERLERSVGFDSLDETYCDYKIIIPQETLKQEKLEDAAEKWVFETNGHKWSNNDDTAGDNYGSFIAGANYQAERMYSEEDLRGAFHVGRLYQGREGDTNFEKWFEQFKKK
jgi:hypothetical protein